MLGSSVMCLMAKQLPPESESRARVKSPRKPRLPCPSINTQFPVPTELCVVMRACRQSMTCSSSGSLAPFVLPQVLPVTPKEAYRGGPSETPTSRDMSMLSAAATTWSKPRIRVVEPHRAFPTCSRVCAHVNWARLSRIDQICACRNRC